MESNSRDFIIAVDDLEILAGFCPESDLSFNCTFQKHSCGWTQSEHDDFNWLLEQGPTVTDGTGPVTDHTTGAITGRYYYFQSRGLVSPQYAVLLSPRVNTAGNQSNSWCFSFWYNMYGEDIGEFEAIVTTNLTEPLGAPIYRLYQQQTSQDVWLQAMANIIDQTEDFYVGLVGRAGSPISNGDIGIDDVDIQPGLCPVDYSTYEFYSLLPDHCLQDNRPFNCSFEDGYCGWTQREGDGDNWLLGAGSTPSSETGPDVDHTLGDETGRYLYFKVSTRNAKPIIDSPVVEVDTEDGVDFCFSFWYSMYGRYIGVLQAYAYNSTMEVFGARGGQTGRRGWLHGLVDIGSVTSHVSFYFKATSNGGLHGDIAIDDINLRMGLCERDTNFNCTFEEGSLCGWVQSQNDDTNWLLEIGDTVTAGTGPESDHTTGSGSYLYLDGNFTSEGDTAVLLSPVVTHTGNAIFSFWYHMYGSGLGRLDVFKTPENGSLSEGDRLFTSGGGPGDPSWIQHEVLSEVTSSFRIALRAVRGPTGLSDIAIDDVGIALIEEETPTTEVTTIQLSTTDQRSVMATTEASTDQTSTAEATVEQSTTDQESGITTTEASINQTPTAEATIQQSTTDQEGGMATTDVSIDQASTRPESTVGVSATRQLIEQTTGSPIDTTSQASPSTDPLVDQLATTGLPGQLPTTSTNDGLSTAGAPLGELSTLRVTSASGGLVQFGTQLLVLELCGQPAVFSDQLRDSTSQLFRERAVCVRNAVIAALRRSPRTSNVVDYEVISFRDGSLLVNGVARFPLDSVIESETLREVLHSDATANNGQIDNSLTIDQSGTVVTVMLNMFAPTEVCPAYHCQNGGVCTQFGSFPDYVYTCECTDGYSGTNCEETDGLVNGGIIAIASTVGAILLCSIVVAMCMCFIMANRSESLYDVQRRKRLAQQDMDHARQRYRYGVRNWTRPAIMPRTVLAMDDGSMDDARAFYGAYDYSTNYRREDGFSGPPSTSPYMIPGPALMRQMDQEMRDDFFY
ncbi:MAM and LDL-receptor class A domain-containing protein 1-like [Patiria miniata]|uniref:Uncharacterized protein n=1 Tax=Patiria miniata TaxID=46514 RepID=A0A913ZN23_PATMI|nr:MAM and LDL-receptor class A domain-containing protein 1-like [Patiria miniata]